MLKSMESAVYKLEAHYNAALRLADLLGDDFPFTPEHFGQGDFLLVAHSERELREIRRALRKVVVDYYDKVSLVFSVGTGDDTIGIARYDTPIPNLRLSLEMPVDKFPSLSKNCHFEKVEEKSPEKKNTVYRYTCSQKEA